MTLQDALAAVVADGKTDAAGFEIRECTQVPDRVHVVFPPDDETGPRT
jgi:hypothetical protein